MSIRVLFLVFIVFLVNVSLVKAQDTNKVEGVVKDADGLTMPGVNITIKGTTQGTITDVDGKYTLEVKTGDKLVFSFVGFKDKELTVGEESTINIVLSPGGKGLEEVVITGFGEVKKRLYTGSSQSMSIDEVKQDGLADVSQMLQGRAAGVSVQSVSGTFGAGPKITIRGSSTISGDGKPLWVIDGVVQEDIINLTADDLVSGDPSTLISSSVAGLNPSDIKSFEILKDASATAIYGSRSLNGVIVITTKKGKKNQPLSVNYTGEFVTREVPGYGGKNLLDSREHLALLKEFQDKGLLDVTTLSQDKNSGVFGILANKLDAYDATTGEFEIKNNPTDINNFLRQYEQANTDWFDVLFKNSVTQSHTISLSAGGEKVNGYASLGYYNDPGWSIADKVQRYTINLKNTYTVFKKGTLGFNILGSYRQQKAPGSDSRKNDDVFGTVSRDFDINPYSYALRTSRTLRPYDSNGNLEYYTKDYAPFNIIKELENNYLEIEVQDVKLQVNFDMPVYKDKIKYSFLTSLRYVNSQRKLNRTEESNVANAYRANATSVIERGNSLLYNPDPGNNLTRREIALPVGGIYKDDNNFLKNVYIRNAVTYSDRFGKDHELDVFVGQEIRYVDRNATSFTGFGLDYGRGLIANTNTNIFLKTIDQEQSKYFTLSNSRERSVSFFSRTTYGYLGKYFGSLTTNINSTNNQVNADGSPKWTPTWTLSGKWNALEEKFVPSNTFLSILQTRIAYGLTATAGKATNSRAILKNEIIARRDVNTRENYVNVVDLQNLDLTWEKQYELNFGLDVGLLKNRVSLNFDVYRRDGFDLFGLTTTPGLGGESEKNINNADMVTNGFEVSIRTVNIKTNVFTWSTTLNISMFNQKITKLEEKPTALDLVNDTGGNIVGFPRNSLFSYQFKGLDEVGMPTFVLPEVHEDYQTSFFQETGETIAGGLTSYLKYEGPVEPNQSYGFQNTFSYKNWNFGVFISGSFGNKIRLNEPFETNGQSNISKKIENRWIKAGDEKITNFPIVPDQRLIETQGTSVYERKMNAYGFSDLFVADGGFIRLKNIRLGYVIPKDMVNKWKLQSVSVNLQLQNVLLLYSDDKLNGIDPEFYNSGGVSSPITRQYTFSLNVRF